MHAQNSVVKFVNDYLSWLTEGFETYCGNSKGYRQASYITGSNEWTENTYVLALLGKLSSFYRHVGYPRHPSFHSCSVVNNEPEFVDIVLQICTVPTCNLQ